MIIDLTDQFVAKTKEFIKLSAALQKQSQNQAQSQQQAPQSYVENVPLQYQLSLKYAKDVYLSLSKIEEILKDKKDNYFSNAAYSLSSFTNQQRNQFDEETKHALTMCSDQINELKQTSDKLNKESQKSRKLNIRSNQTYSAHLNQVILGLHYYFKRLQDQFGQFLRYNQIKKKKILNTLSIEPQKIHKQPHYFQKKRQINAQNHVNLENTNAQLERQAHLFYVQKIQDHKKTLQTKQTIQSINQILQEMGKKVLDQEILTSSFEQIGSVGLSFIEQGNKNLLEANTLSKQTGKYWVFLFLCLAFSLHFVDFLKS